MDSTLDYIPYITFFYVIVLLGLFILLSMNKKPELHHTQVLFSILIVLFIFKHSYEWNLLLNAKNNGYYYYPVLVILL